MHEGKIRWKDSGLECLATSMDGKEIPVPEKPQVDESSPRDVIEYKGKIFEVPSDMIFYLSKQPDVLRARINRALENGMGFIYPDGSYGCWYCNHYTDNLAKTFSEGNIGVQIHNLGGCAGYFSERMYVRRNYGC